MYDQLYSIEGLAQPSHERRQRAMSLAIEMRTLLEEMKTEFTVRIPQQFLFSRLMRHFRMLPLQIVSTATTLHFTFIYNSTSYASHRCLP